ncbi:MAG: hypothetical protein ACP5RW_09080 [bacterium]
MRAVFKINFVRDVYGRFTKQTPMVKAAVSRGLDMANVYLTGTKWVIFFEQPWPPPKSESYRRWKIKKGYGNMTYQLTGETLHAMRGRKVAWNILEWGVIDNARAAEKLRANEAGEDNRIPRPFFTKILDTCRPHVAEIVREEVRKVLLSV